MKKIRSNFSYLIIRILKGNISNIDSSGAGCAVLRGSLACSSPDRLFAITASFGFFRNPSVSRLFSLKTLTTGFSGGLGSFPSRSFCSPSFFIASGFAGPTRCCLATRSATVDTKDTRTYGRTVLQ